MRILLQIVSDSEVTHDVYYTISGPGINLPPIRVFSLDKFSGMLTVHQAVDREMYPKFIVSDKTPFNLIG